MKTEKRPCTPSSHLVPKKSRGERGRERDKGFREELYEKERVWD